MPTLVLTLWENVNNKLIDKGCDLINLYNVLLIAVSTNEFIQRRQNSLTEARS